MLKAGLVGTGFISDEHVLGYRGCADAEIVAVCDLDLGRARGWLERWEMPAARAYDSVERMLDGETLDLVEILTPQTQHYAHVVQCAGAGVPFVSVQKPMAVGIAQCDRMIEACRASGTVLRLYENYVFYPVYHEAKRLLDDGIIGALTSVRIHTIGGVRDGAPWPHFWVPVDVQQSRSSVLVGDDGLHKFSLACWLMDRDIERVSSWIDPETPLDAPAFIRAKFRTRPGEPAKYAQIDFNFSTRLAIPSDVWLDDFVEICGERGVMWIHQCAGAGDRPLFKGNRMSSSSAFPPIAVFVDGRVSTYLDHLSARERNWSTSFVACTRHFIGVATDGGTPICTGEQGRDLNRYATAALLSAQDQRDVDLVEVTSEAEEQGAFELRDNFCRIDSIMEAAR